MSPKYKDFQSKFFKLVRAIKFVKVYGKSKN